MRDGRCLLCWVEVLPADRMCSTCHAVVRDTALILLALATIAAWAAYFGTH